MAQSQVAVLVYYSTDHAILDMLAGHTHGFPVVVAAGEPDGVGMEQLMMVECGMEVEADDGVQEHHTGKVHDGHREQLVAAQLADNKVLADEDLFVHWLFDFGFQLMGSCC